MTSSRVCSLVLPFCLLPISAMAAYSQLPPIAPGVPHELAIWRAARYSDVRYKLNLTLEKMSPVLKGTIEIRVNISPGAKASDGTRTLLSASPHRGEIVS